MRRNPALHRLRAGQSCIGTFILEFASTGMARTVASAGAEFLVYDQEHTGWTNETIRMLLAASRASDVMPLVRVPNSDPHNVSIALALGAMGVMVPMVQTAEETRQIVAAAKYPPAGKRGFAVLYVDEHGGDVARYMREANEEVMVVVMVETTTAMENLEAIASVDGVDVLWIGHYDLTASLGIPGQFEHPQYRRALEAVVAACRRHGKAAGMSVESVEEGRRLMQQGFRFIGYGHDLVLLRESLARGIEDLRRS